MKKSKDVFTEEDRPTACGHGSFSEPAWLGRGQINTPEPSLCIRLLLVPQPFTTVNTCMTVTARSAAKHSRDTTTTTLHPLRPTRQRKLGNGLAHKTIKTADGSQKTES